MKNSNKIVTIRTKIISIIFIVIFVTAVPLSNLILNLYENRILKELKIQGAMNSRILSETAFKSIMMAHGDLASVRINGVEMLLVYRPLFLRGLVMAESVMLSSRKKYNGIVISRIIRDDNLRTQYSFRERYSAAEAEKFRSHPGRKLITVKNQNLVEFVSLSGPAGMKPICASRMLFSDKEIREPLRQLRFIIYGITFLAVFIVGLLSVFVTSFVSRPIARLTETVKKIESGDMDCTADIHSNDEIGKFAIGFNNMMNAINNSVAFINDIVESMPSVLVAISAEGKITHWNSAASVFSAQKRENVLGRNLSDVYRGFEKFQCDFLQVLQNGEPLIFYRERFEDHPDSYYNVFLYPLKTRELISGLVLRIDDISLIEKKELQLQQAQKMEMIGTLSSGMAHEFNNILGGILGTISIWKYQLDNSMTLNKTEVMEDLKLIEESGLSAVELVKQLLNLSGGSQDVEFSEFDLNDVIRNISKVCSKSLSPIVESEFIIYDDQALILGNKNHVEQIILNLCINAAHSMTIMRLQEEPQGGKLTVSLHEYIADDTFCEVHPEAEDRYWLIRVEDTGVGMDEETIKKIFDPFFTTKEQGKGTGLGLSVVYSMIKKHNSFIDVNSVPGKGTAFEVFFPKFIKNET